MSPRIKQTDDYVYMCRNRSIQQAVASRNCWSHLAHPFVSGLSTQIYMGTEMAAFGRLRFIVVVQTGVAVHGPSTLHLVGFQNSFGVRSLALIGFV